MDHGPIPYKARGLRTSTLKAGSKHIPEGGVEVSRYHGTMVIKIRGIGQITLVCRHGRSTFQRFFIQHSVRLWRGVVSRPELPVLPTKHKPRPPPLSRKQPIRIGTGGRNTGPGGHRAGP